MSDWFENKNSETTPDPVVPETPAVPEAPEAGAPEANGETSASAEKATSGAPTSGWSSVTPPVWGAVAPPQPEAPSTPENPAAPVTPPQPNVPQPPVTPPQPNVPQPPVTPPSTGWQSVPQNSWQSTPQNNWQNTPQNGYRPPVSPYGWNPQPVPPVKPKKKKSGTAILVAVLAVVCAVCLITSVVLLVKNSQSNTGLQQGGSSSGGSSSQSQNPGSVNENAPSIVTADPEEEGLSSRAIVDANLNSTVILRMYTTSGTNSFFGQAGGEETEAGEATGIVWTADGYIITNAHCVYNEDTASKFSRIEIELYNGTIFESATIVGYDTTTDLAVLKVDAANLVPAVFGDSNTLALGDRVVALGNNSGLGWTVTGGMVSGLARDVYEETNYAIKCLQVDAVINPGNSGGPLLNSSGQVIGINSAKIVATGYEGLGFSIPINEASDILEDLVTYGYVKGRIMLGIEGYTFNRYSGYEGFYISAIGSNSSFAGTAAQVGDIITRVDGVRIESYAEMREQLTKHQVGDTVTITLIRISRTAHTPETFDVTITLMESDGSV